MITPFFCSLHWYDHYLVVALPDGEQCRKGGIWGFGSYLPCLVIVLSNLESLGCSDSALRGLPPYS